MAYPCCNIPTIRHSSSRDPWRQSRHSRPWWTSSRISLVYDWTKQSPPLSSLGYSQRRWVADPDCAHWRLTKLVPRDVDCQSSASTPNLASSIQEGSRRAWEVGGHASCCAGVAWFCWMRSLPLYPFTTCRSSRCWPVSGDVLKSPCGASFSEVPSPRNHGGVGIRSLHGLPCPG